MMWWGAGLMVVLALTTNASCVTYLDVSHIPVPLLTYLHSSLKPSHVHKPAVKPPDIIRLTVRAQDVPGPAMRTQDVPRTGVGTRYVSRPGVGTQNVQRPAVRPTITTAAPVMAVSTTVSSKTPTTTLDSLTAFCQEACKQGVGGPECDCPEHPSIGRRHAPLLPSSMNPFLRPSNAGLALKPGLLPEERVTGSNDKTASSTTTKDPLIDFCEVACKNGQGSVACNCPGHIIGRRSVTFQSTVVALGWHSVASHDIVGGLSQRRRTIAHKDSAGALRRQGRLLTKDEVNHHDNPKMSDLCMEWCQQGLGGSACDCDRLPQRLPITPLKTKDFQSRALETLSKP
ncbi:uncharacterized protein [Panulirus ornatus]|uniref:uncharacterized protein n=1 Tax=Panulirus ornatus TaxID=150431 RepID=UPI003A85528B